MYHAFRISVFLVCFLCNKEELEGGDNDNDEAEKKKDEK